MFHRVFFWRLLGGHLLFGLLGLLVVVGIVLLIVYLTDRKYKSPKATKSVDAPAAATAEAAPVAAVASAQDRFLTILSEQKATANMGAAEYEERRMVLEGGRGDNHANDELVALKERYARGELTTGAYVKARNKLLGLD